MEISLLIQTLQAIEDNTELEVIVTGQIRLVNQELDLTISPSDPVKPSMPTPAVDPD